MTVTKIRSLPRARGLLLGRSATTRRGLLFEFVIIVIGIFIGMATGLLIWGGSWVFAVVVGVILVLTGWSARVYRYRRFVKSS